MAVYLSELDMDIKIETATLDFLNELYEIEKDSFAEEAFTQVQIRSLLIDYNTIALIARQSEKIVGFVIALIEMTRNRSFGHIITIDVSPPFRRRGIAERLLQNVEAQLKEKGVNECRLEVREDNIAALNLYLKLGYHKVGRLEKYYGTAHGLYLRKSI